MSIELGNNKIIDMYKGNKEVIKIYKGNQKIYDLFGDIDYENLANNSGKAIKYVIRHEGVPEGGRGQIKNVYYSASVPDLPMRLVDGTFGRYTEYQISTNAVFESVYLLPQTYSYGSGQNYYTSGNIGYNIGSNKIYDPENISYCINEDSYYVYYYQSHLQGSALSRSVRCFIPCTVELNVNGAPNNNETNNKSCFNYYENIDYHLYQKYVYNTQTAQGYGTRTLNSDNGYAYTISSSPQPYSKTMVVSQGSRYYIAPCFAL